ncbi:hypothetical protein C7S14_5704 [Burkholderia cepacia]|nr:hypothetical protein C7S14_5704 [Burkholderia cepacia]
MVGWRGAGRWPARPAYRPRCGPVGAVPGAAVPERRPHGRRFGQL